MKESGLAVVICDVLPHKEELLFHVEVRLLADDLEGFSAVSALMSPSAPSLDDQT
jgi:hypothetical protein